MTARWWTAHDVASYCGLSVRSVYNMVRRAKDLRDRGEDGGIPFNKPRGTGYLRFKPEAVRAFFGDVPESDDEGIERAVQQLARTTTSAESDSARVVSEKVAAGETGATIDELLGRFVTAGSALAHHSDASRRIREIAQAYELVGLSIGQAGKPAGKGDQTITDEPDKAGKTDR